MYRRYDVTEDSLKGIGGFAKVYRATQKSSNEIVAVKTIHPTELNSDTAIKNVKR
jgi:hypothetical protein